MFADAIDTAAQFTRPVHSIFRHFGSTEVQRSAATLFFVNSDGWALTCRHVAEQFLAASQVSANYQSFKAEKAALPGKNRRHLENALEKKYGLGKATVVELKSSFISCIHGPLNLDIHLHPELDLALLKFSDFTALGVTNFPVFAQDGSKLRQGRFLCRLGFPFPEFTNFAYDAATDAIDWSTQGIDQVPRFPIEGMVTRHISASGEIVSFEMSTPGLRGQSGGPAFDTQGRIWGMQAATAHLDLNFDVEMEVSREGRKKRISDYAFLHVGHCIHLDVLKSFMRQHNVSFNEG